MRHVLRLNEELPETPAEEKASTLSLLQCPHSAVSVAVCQLPNPWMLARGGPYGRSILTKSNRMTSLRGVPGGGVTR